MLDHAQVRPNCALNLLVVGSIPTRPTIPTPRALASSAAASSRLSPLPSRVRAVCGVAILAVLAACASSTGAPSGRAAEGAATAVFGIAMIAVTPVALVGVPFAALVHPREFRGPAAPALVLSGPVSVDEAYLATYGVHADSQEVDQTSGQVIRAGMVHARSMLDAQITFEHLAWRYGLHDVRYRICREEQAAGGRQYLLLSLVYRKTPKFATALHKVDPLVPEVSSDTVIDWVAVDAASLEDDRVYALLIAAAVDEALHTPHAPPSPTAEYWGAAHHWRSGDVDFVLALSRERARQLLPSLPAAH